MSDVQNNLLQNTVKSKILFSGVGVHNGRAVSMSIEPAEENTGIIFVRTDIKQNKGDKTFLKKWGITHKFFKKYYLKSRTPYKGPLSSPDKSAQYYFELIICKIRFFYSLIIKQSEKKWN